MSKEKQIEEMIEFLNNRINVERNSYFGKGCLTIPLIEAERILDILESFRKQIEGEWISVEDRLPESTKMVLCYTPCDGYIFVGYYQEVEPNPYFKSYWNIITAMRSTRKVTKKVTHWKPLPEPPKMKGE